MRGETYVDINGIEHRYTPWPNPKSSSPQLERSVPSDRVKRLYDLDAQFLSILQEMIELENDYSWCMKKLSCRYKQRLRLLEMKLLIVKSELIRYTQ